MPEPELAQARNSQNNHGSKCNSDVDCGNDNYGVSLRCFNGKCNCPDTCHYWSKLNTCGVNNPNNKNTYPANACLPKVGNKFVDNSPQACPCQRWVCNSQTGECESKSAAWIGKPAAGDGARSQTECNISCKKLPVAPPIT